MAWLCCQCVCVCVTVCLSQVDIDNVPRPLAITAPINRLSNLRSTITKRIQFRRSVRSSITAGTLPAPDSASAASSGHEDEDDNGDNHDQSTSTDHQTSQRQDSRDSLDSNSTDAIAARYADNPFQRTPNVSAQNEGDTKRALTKTASSLYDSNDIALPMTSAPGPPNVGRPPRLVTSTSTSGSVGGAMAAGIDADYLAVTVDQQNSSVSRHVSQFLCCRLCRLLLKCIIERKVKFKCFALCNQEIFRKLPVLGRLCFSPVCLSVCLSVSGITKNDFLVKFVDAVGN